MMTELIVFTSKELSVLIGGLKLSIQLKDDSRKLKWSAGYMAYN